MDKEIVMDEVKRISRVGTVVFAVAGGVACSDASEAGSNERDFDAQGTEASSGDHCVLELPSENTFCYESFGGALSAATQGRIDDAPDDVRAAMDDPELEQRINDLSLEPQLKSGATVVIGIQYWNRFFQGSTYTITASAGCDGDVNTWDWGLTSLSPGPVAPWDNAISSVKAFSRCSETLYDNTNYGGASSSLHVISGDLGVMDNQTSSIRWY